MEKELAKDLIRYFKSLGIEVYTNTKARGHQGFFLKNRIDISRHTKEERVIPTLLHEFTHFIHSKIEPDMPKTGGSLEALFKIEESENRFGFAFGLRNLFSSNNEPESLELSSSALEKELLAVTNFVDENSLCLKLLAHRDQIKKRIKSFEAVIKEDYPDFMRSKTFKDFDRYIKKSKAKYLMKYDRVKLITPFLRRQEIFTIDNLEKDFPDIPRSFCAYIRLKSAQKKQSRNSKRINSLKKYYSKPTELFSRFIEGLYIDSEKTLKLAPNASKRFFELLDCGHYFELKNVFEMLQVITV